LGCEFTEDMDDLALGEGGSFKAQNETCRVMAPTFGATAAASCAA
jgi:hypothetical protein